jgi:predicted CxxxxCH...CXXCH cytochrome family protein
VPTAVDSPGHIDHAPGAIVFPAGTSTLARSDGAAPAWDGASGRCDDVYCHGGGRALGGDATPGLARRPRWSDGSAVAVCGACHGVPPRDAAHDPSLSLTDCVRCHGRTMDATGALLRGGAHLDGAIDAP